MPPGTAKRQREPDGIIRVDLLAQREKRASSKREVEQTVGSLLEPRPCMTSDSGKGDDHRLQFWIDIRERRERCIGKGEIEYEIANTSRGQIQITLGYQIIGHQD